MEYQIESRVVEDSDILTPFNEEDEKEIDLALEYHLAFSSDDTDVDKIERDTAKFMKQKTIKHFRSNYTYTSNKEDQLTLIVSDGSTLSSKAASSSGIIWVAVGGRDSICLVILKKLDKTCVGGSFYVRQRKSTILRFFMETILYEIEEGSFKEINTSNGDPFGIVSVIPGTSKFEASGSEALGDEYDEKAAIEFLSKTMKYCNSVLVRQETIEAAIGALYHMCFGKIKAEDILVKVLNVGGANYANTYGGCDMIYVIKDYLSVLRKKARKSHKIAEKHKQKQAARLAEDMLKQHSPSDLNDH